MTSLSFLAGRTVIAQSLTECIMDSLKKNSEYSNKMPHIATFHPALHCLLRVVSNIF